MILRNKLENRRDDVSIDFINLNICSNFFIKPVHSQVQFPSLFQFQNDIYTDNHFNSLKFEANKSLNFLFLTGEEPPKMHIANLAFRFVLELGAFCSMAWWGYDQSNDATKYLLMLAVPTVAAVSWALFTVPNDPSRGKNGPVQVSGFMRLLLEGAFFGFATWAIHDLGEDIAAAYFGSAVVLHYSFSFDRIKWLLKQ